MAVNRRFAVSTHNRDIGNETEKSALFGNFTFYFIKST